MAKKIRFPLEMDNGTEVRSMEELREHFSLAKVLEYFENGKLVIWLRDRYANDIADAVEALELNDQELAKKLSEIFDVPYDEKAEEELKIAEERAKRLERLKEFTDNEQFFDKVDNVAFEQDELYDLLDEDVKVIYLCGDRFSIPLSQSGVSYIGINKPTAVIDSKAAIDWSEKRISIEGVVFDEKYQGIVDGSQKSAGKEDEESWKREQLKKYGITEDWQINWVAFSQKELNEMLDRGDMLAIDLYGEHFSIPMDKIIQKYKDKARRGELENTFARGEHIRFTGINNPTVVIESNLHDFCEDKEVVFTDVKFADDNYRKAYWVKEAYYYKKDELSISIWELFNSTAFDQADLSKLLHNGVNPVYLTGNGPFYISVDKKNIKYIGMSRLGDDKPNVIIDTKDYVDLEEKGIKLEDVKIDDAFNELEITEFGRMLEELEYYEFVEAYEERHPQESAQLGEKEYDRRINEAYGDYKRFLEKHRKQNPEKDLTSEESYKIFFGDDAPIPLSGIFSSIGSFIGNSLKM